MAEAKKGTILMPTPMGIETSSWDDPPLLILNYPTKLSLHLGQFLGSMSGPMPSLNIRKVGDGPRCYAVWLDTWPVFLDGLDGLPHIGDRFEIDGELWRVVEIYDRIICEREPS